MSANATSRDWLAYAADGFWRQYGDPRVPVRYPFMSGSPAPVLLIAAAYLAFVRYLGPWMMRSRQPLDLRHTMRVYNLAVGLGNLCGFCRALWLTNFGLDYFGCRPAATGAPEENELIAWGMVCFAGKLAELVDTVFFVLRKKHAQTSNLHVFHHGLIPVLIWAYLRLAPGGSSVMFPMLNAGVHAAMYAYYYLATFKGMRGRIWWKRHLTEAQILQFLLSMLHFGASARGSCNYPVLLALGGFFFNLVFLVLFCNFYRRTYLVALQEAASERKKSQ